MAASKTKTTRLCDRCYLPSGRQSSSGGKKVCSQGYGIILVGHEKHDEIVGTSGEAPQHVRIVANLGQAKTVTVPDPDKVAVLTQTTLSVDDTRDIIDVLKQRFPKIITPAKEDICYATQNRQDAVKQLTPRGRSGAGDRIRKQ